MKDREAWLAAVHGISKLLNNSWDIQIPSLKGVRDIYTANFVSGYLVPLITVKRLECFLDNRKFSAE